MLFFSKTMKEHGVNIFEKNEHTRNDKEINAFGHGVLHKAVIVDDRREIRRLIADGYDKKITDSTGFTATELAIILEKEWLLPYLDGSGDSDEEEKVTFVPTTYKCTPFEERLRKRRFARYRINSVGHKAFEAEKRKHSSIWLPEYTNQHRNKNNIILSGVLSTTDTTQFASSSDSSEFISTSNIVNKLAAILNQPNKYNESLTDVNQHLADVNQHLADVNQRDEKLKQLEVWEQRMNCNDERLEISPDQFLYPTSEPRVIIEKEKVIESTQNHVSSDYSVHCRNDDNDRLLNLVTCFDNIEDRSITVQEQNVVPTLILPLTTNCNYSNNHDAYSDSGFSTLRSVENDVNNNNKEKNNYANLLQDYEKVTKNIYGKCLDHAANENDFYSYDIQEWIENRGTYADLNTNEDGGYQTKRKNEDQNVSPHIAEYLRDVTNVNSVQITNSVNSEVSYTKSVCCCEEEYFHTKETTQGFYKKCEVHKTNRDLKRCHLFVEKHCPNERRVICRSSCNHFRTEKFNIKTNITSTRTGKEYCKGHYPDEFLNTETTGGIHYRGSLSNKLRFVHESTSCRSLKRSNSWPTCINKDKLVKTSKKNISDSMAEDWEVWDVEGDNHKIENSNDVFANSIHSEISNQTFELNDSSKDEVKLTYTAPVKPSQNNSANINVTTPTLDVKERSQSTSTSLTPHSNLTDDPRGFTSSYTLDATGNEEKHILVVPSMKKSRSFTSISGKVNEESDSKEDSDPKGLSKSYQHDLTKTKKKSKFLSFFGARTPKSKESPTSNRSRVSSTSSEDPRGFSNSYSIDQSTGEEKHVLVVPKRSGSISSTTPINDNLNDTSGISESSQSSNTCTPSKKINRKLSLDEKNVGRPDSGYFSTDEYKKNTKLSYSITFTPEESIVQKSEPRSNSTPFSPLQEGLLPLLVGFGLGEEEGTQDILHNVLSPHTVEEHGYFSLGSDPEKHTPAKEKAGTSTGHHDIEKNKEGELDSLATSKKNDAETTSSQDPTEETNETVPTFSDNEDDFKDEPARSIRPTRISISEQFCELLDTDYDYPNHSTPNKDLVSVDNTNNSTLNKDLVSVDNTNNSTPNKDLVSVANTNTETKGESFDLPTDKDSHDGVEKNIPLLNFEVEDDSAPGLQQGSANGQLPKYDELFSNTNSTNGDSASSNQLDSASSVDQEDPHSSGGGVFTVFHHSSSQHSQEDTESLASSETDEEENTKHSYVEDAFEFDANSNLEDSIASFEQHEEEYNASNQMSPWQGDYATNQVPRVQEELSADEEDDKLYQDYNDIHEERKMTKEILSYMPPILERSVEVHEIDQNEVQPVPEKELDQTDSKRVIISEEHDNTTEDVEINDKFLDDFVNIIIREDEEEEEEEASNQLQEPISSVIPDEETKTSEVPDIYVAKNADVSITDSLVNREHVTEVEKIDEQHEFTEPKVEVVDEPNSNVRINEQENLKNARPENNTIFEFTLPLEDSTAPLITPIKDDVVLLKPDTEKVAKSKPSLEDAGNQDQALIGHQDDTDPMYFSNDYNKHVTNEIRLSEKSTIAVENEDNIESDVITREPEHDQKKCLWYDYNVENDLTEQNDKQSYMSPTASDKEIDSPVITRKGELTKQSTLQKDGRKKKPLLRDPSMAWDGLVEEYHEFDSYEDEEKLDVIVDFELAEDDLLRNEDPKCDDVVTSDDVTDEAKYREEDAEDEFKLDAQKRNDSYLTLTFDSDDEELEEGTGDEDYKTESGDIIKDSCEEDEREEHIVKEIDENDEGEDDQESEAEENEYEGEYMIEDIGDNEDDVGSAGSEDEVAGNEKEGKGIVKDIYEDVEKLKLADSTVDDVGDTEEGNDTDDVENSKQENYNNEEIKYLVKAIDEHYREISSATINEKIKTSKHRMKKSPISSDTPFVVNDIRCDTVDCSTVTIEGENSGCSHDDKDIIEEVEIGNLEYDTYEMDFTILTDTTFNDVTSIDENIPDQELSITKRIYSKKKKRLQPQETEDFTVISDDECSILDDFQSPRSISSPVPTKDVKIITTEEKRKTLLSDEYTVISFDDETVPGSEQKDNACEISENNIVLEEEDITLSEKYGHEFNSTSSFNERSNTPISKGLSRSGSFNGRVSSPNVFAKKQSAHDDDTKNFELKNAKELNKNKYSASNQHFEDTHGETVPTDDEKEQSFSERFGQKFNLTSSYQEQSHTPTFASKGVSRSSSFNERVSSLNIFTKRHSADEANIKTIELKNAKELTIRSSSVDSKRNSLQRQTETRDDTEIVDTDEEDVDSGLELPRDDVSLSESTERLHYPMKLAEDNFDYILWSEKIKPTLHNPKTVAQLYLRLSTQYFDQKRQVYNLQQIQMGRMAYWLIHDNKSCNFASVISYLLSFLNVIKSEDREIQNVNVESLLVYLTDMIKEDKMLAKDIIFFACFLSRPNTALQPHHATRVRFLHACFTEEVKQVKHTSTLNYLTTCFIKISEYFVQVDNQLAQKIVEEHLLPYILDHYSMQLVLNILKYMGLLKSEEPVSITYDITSSLILLDIIVGQCKLQPEAITILEAFIRKDSSKFQFCKTEQQALLNKLRNL